MPVGLPRLCRNKTLKGQVSQTGQFARQVRAIILEHLLPARHHPFLRIKPQPSLDLRHQGG